MREVRTVSENVSSNGIYCFLMEGIENGTSVEVVVTLPEQVTLSAWVKLRCLARVQRCELKSSGKQGMAATFEQIARLEPHC